jgi:hypothetical protein
MSKPIRLLPCPFCGGPPCPYVGHNYRGGGFKEHEDWDRGISATAFVFCHECGAQSESEDGIVFSYEEARDLLPKAVQWWQDRSLRNLELYLAGTDKGLNMFPRQSE